jgi:hypothetical protein
MPQATEMTLSAFFQRRNGLPVLIFKRGVTADSFQVQKERFKALLHLDRQFILPKIRTILIIR